MRCLFCKQDSSSAKSIEHIVPESLGNKTFILPRGYVCDKCNNYFAREVEKPFLNQFDMRLLRFEQAIPNKKNKIPSIPGIILSSPVTVRKDIIGGEIVTGIEMPPELFTDIVNKQENTVLVLPALLDDTLPPQSPIVSRFLAKIALEALAARLKDSDGWLDYLIDDCQLDLIRNHARIGQPKIWPCNIRRIYSTDTHWQIEGEDSQVIYECDFLFPNVVEDDLKEDYIQSEIYFIIALWGIEFAINLGGPEISGYEQWLSDHNDISPLYYGKNASK